MSHRNFKFLLILLVLYILFVLYILLVDTWVEFFIVSTKISRSDPPFYNCSLVQFLFFIVGFVNHHRVFI